MRIRLLTAMAALAGTVLTATPATAATPCTWTATRINPPAGYDARYTGVGGTDSHGSYAGTALTSLGRSPVVVTWTNDRPTIVSDLFDVSWPSVVGEDSAGTILVSSYGQNPILYSRAGVRTTLTPPEGYATDSAVAMNENSGVIARGHDKDNHPVTLYWSGVAAGPIVIDSPYGQGIDLDDDGTVLLADGALWQAGVTTVLQGEAPLHFDAIRNGKVVGFHAQDFPKGQALLWNGGPAPLPIDGGAAARALNVTGLTAGTRDGIYGIYGTPAVWQGTTFVADLPLPAGTTSSDRFVVGDNGVIFGGTNTGPVRWTCS